jgi:hypothetical protein
VDPDPHGSASNWCRIRICIKVISWIRILIKLQVSSQNVCNMSLFEHFFNGLSLYLEAMIRILFRVKGWIWIRIKVIRIRNTVFIWLWFCYIWEFCCSNNANSVNFLLMRILFCFFKKWRGPNLDPALENRPHPYLFWFPETHLFYPSKEIWHWAL